VYLSRLIAHFLDYNIVANLMEKYTLCLQVVRYEHLYQALCRSNFMFLIEVLRDQKVKLFTFHYFDHTSLLFRLEHRVHESL